MHKLHKLRLAAIAALAGIFAGIAGCTSDVPEIPHEELYMREFVKRFGAIDPAHNWNGATRATVDVVTDRPSTVSISGIIDGRRYLLAQYREVQGARTLGFDIPHGYSDIRVTDGFSAVFTKIGGKVNFADGSRKIFPENSDDIVKISVTDEYRHITNRGVTSFNDSLPEHKYNLNKLTQDFAFVSKGPFTIYPVFWYTNNSNTLGVYYIRDNGTPDGEIVHVPFYSIKDGADHALQYLPGSKYRPAVAPEWTQPGRSYRFSRWEGGKFVSSGHNFFSYTDEDWTEFEANFADVLNREKDYNILHSAMGFDHTQWDMRDIDEVRYEYTYDEGTRVPLLTGLHLTAIAEQYDNADFVDAPNGNTSYVDDAAFWRSKGIVIDVPVGTLFGMYIETNGNTRFYSQARRNPDLYYKRTPDFKDLVRDEQGQPIPLGNACHATTYAYHAPTGHRYQVLTFEDWVNNTQSLSDFDMNDLVFFIDSDEPLKTPDVVDENLGERYEWILACEDLGDKDDFDFNDVVLSISHISGHDEAEITALAAGGTLETYVYYKDAGGTERVLGDCEWHENFGVYDHTQMINTQRQVTHTGRTHKISVHEDFTLSPRLHDSNGGALGVTQLKQNMGGIFVRVVREDGSIGEIMSPTATGSAPQMILVPQSHHDGTALQYSNSWEWPIERHAIDQAYPFFREWIKDSRANADWHVRSKNPIHVVKR